MDLFMCFMAGVFSTCMVIGAVARLEPVPTTMPPIRPICYPNGHIQNGWQIVMQPLDYQCARYVA